MEREQIRQALFEVLKEKGQRKFVQTVDLGINFRGIDFSKQENRLNLEVLLPKGKGREQPVAVFADGQMAVEARDAGVELVLSGDDIPKLAADPARLKPLLEYEFLAAPQLMAVVGKYLGQVLGTRGKLPKPIMGASVRELVERARRTVKVRSKGKFLPVVHCPVGTENMAVDDIADNIEAVLEKVRTKVGEQNIKSAYVKLTMGKPVYIGAVKAKAEAVA